MGFYCLFLFSINLIISEKFSIFLVSAIKYHNILFSENKNIANFIIASLLLSWLAHTKVFYGYVILTSLFTVLIAQFFKKVNLWKTIFMLMISLLLCMPYLYHNYRISGKIFYWATSGGLSL